MTEKGLTICQAFFAEGMKWVVRPPITGHHNVEVMALEFVAELYDVQGKYLGEWRMVEFQGAVCILCPAAGYPNTETEN